MAEPKGIGEEVRELLKQGVSYSTIANKLDCSKATISYHAGKLGLREDIENTRYDWDEIQSYYDEGHSIRETIKHFGMARRTWWKAKQRSDVVSRGRKPLKPLHELKSRSSVRRRVINHDLFPYECSICGIDEWRDKELSLNLDHINGDGDDHRLENLRWVCPNCDTQLPTYCGRNMDN